MKDFSKLVIILGGPGGSGRSTIAEGLAEKLNLRRIYGGGIQRQICLEVGYGDIDKFSGKLKFNEEKFGKYLSEYVPKHPEIDLKIDTKLFEASYEGGVIIESMNFAPIIKRLNLPYIKIWITAEEKERARRICEREQKFGNIFSIDEMIEITKKRNETDKKRYNSIYGCDIFDFENIYDFVFDTTDVPKENMVSEMIKIIEKLIQ